MNDERSKEKRRLPGALPALAVFGTLLAVVLFGSVFFADAGSGHNHEAMRQNMLEGADTDGDGQISEEELAAWQEAKEAEIEEKLAEKFDEIDSDDDGQISADEWNAMIEAKNAEMEEKMAEKLAQMEERNPERFAENEEKRAERHAEMEAKRVEKQAERFDKMDSDDDGQISEEEWNAWHGEHREEAREKRDQLQEKGERTPGRGGRGQRMGQRPGMGRGR